MSLTRNADPLREIARRLGVPDLKTQTLKPGVNETLRVTVHYRDGTHPDSIGTVIRGIGPKVTIVAVYDVYDSARQPYVYRYEHPVERYQKTLVALRQNRFDMLDDAPDLSVGDSLWFIERGSGTFYHDVLVAPAAARGHHREILGVIRANFPEAIKPLSV